MWQRSGRKAASALCLLCAFDRVPTPPLLAELPLGTVKMWAVIDLHTDQPILAPAHRRHEKTSRLRAARPKSPQPRTAYTNKLMDQAQKLIDEANNPHYLEIIDLRDHTVWIRDHLMSLKWLHLAWCLNLSQWEAPGIRLTTCQVDLVNAFLQPITEQITEKTRQLTNRLTAIENLMTRKLNLLPAAAAQAFSDEIVWEHTDDGNRPGTIKQAWRRFPKFVECSVFLHQSKRARFDEMLTELERVQATPFLAERMPDPVRFATKVFRDPRLTGTNAQMPGDIINARLVRAAATGTDVSWLRPGDGAEEERFKPFLQQFADYSGLTEHRMPPDKYGWRFCHAFQTPGGCGLWSAFGSL